MSGQDSEAQHTENEGKETTQLTETCRELHNVCVCVCVCVHALYVCVRASVHAGGKECVSAHSSLSERVRQPF